MQLDLYSTNLMLIDLMLPGVIKPYGGFDHIVKGQIIAIRIAGNRYGFDFFSFFVISQCKKEACTTACFFLTRIFEFVSICSLFISFVSYLMR